MRFFSTLLLVGGLATLSGCATQASKVDQMLADTLAQPLWKTASCAKAICSVSSC